MNKRCGILDVFYSLYAATEKDVMKKSDCSFDTKRTDEMKDDDDQVTSSSQQHEGTQSIQCASIIDELM